MCSESSWTVDCGKNSCGSIKNDGLTCQATVISHQVYGILVVTISCNIIDILYTTINSHWCVFFKYSCKIITFCMYIGETHTNPQHITYQLAQYLRRLLACALGMSQSRWTASCTIMYQQIVFAYNLTVIRDSYRCNDRDNQYKFEIKGYPIRERLSSQHPLWICFRYQHSSLGKKKTIAGTPEHVIPTPGIWELHTDWRLSDPAGII